MIRYLIPPLLVVIGTSAFAADPPADQAPTPEQLSFFEKKIRPVLIAHCYECHSQDAKKEKGGLLLDTRAGIRKGGETGPAVVPGDLTKSLLIKAIRHTDKKIQMPKDKLPAEVIADFEKWVSSGAADPREGAVAPKAIAKNEIDIEKGRKFWAFQPVKKPTPPKTTNADWARSDIDRFLLASMESKGLKPVADADPRTLIRRVYFDLIGLPPTPEDVEQFAKEYSTRPQEALAAVVDKLLASKQFGERWGRHWLDVARFAESSGKSANTAYPHAWRYRDYVIAAFNADKPYDQFVREQLAGDLLGGKDDKEKAERLIATGFLAIGAKNHDERNRQQFQMDLADEQIDTTFQAFQAMTVACARCHDHKFDPIPQKDYYALAGIFRSTETCYGTVRVINSNHPSSLIDLPKGAEAVKSLEPLTQERREAIEKQIKDIRTQIADLTGQDTFIQRIFLQNRITIQQSQLDSYEADGTPKTRAMGVKESRLAADSKLYVRGELNQPGETVRRGFPQVMTTKQPSISRGSSGRKELANWIASKENPLTARVMANRVWMQLIGQGLVTSIDNFGASGNLPNHPELLDHLAVTFVEKEWSVKQLIRTIVMTRAYQLSTKFDEKNFDVDPDNVYVWRMPSRRLEAEAIRDTMLTLGGRLDLTPPKGSPIARQGEGGAGGFRGGAGAGDPSATATYRTVYLPIVRDRLPEVLTVFDFPDPSLITGERATTTVPAQSLYLMNNPFVIRQAEAMADGLLASGDDEAGKLKRAYQLAYSRQPVEKEIKASQKFLEEYGKKHTKRATWAAFCQALFASAEFTHR